MLTQEIIGGLDLGIRELVVLLNDAGFVTCDSGDGYSKFKTRGREEGELDYPHVFIQCSRSEFFTQLDEVARFLVSLGISLEHDDTVERPPFVQGTANPNDECCLIEVGNILSVATYADVGAT